MLVGQSVRQLAAAARLLLGFTLLLGLAYPLLIAGVGRVVAPAHAEGSPAHAQGRTVGSALVGQAFTGSQWFHPRPSAAGDAGYDALASGASNLGPNSPELVAAIEQRRRSYARENGVDPRVVPPDALTASASGLDPDISPENARLQVRRIARARGLQDAAVRQMVDAAERGRPLGVLGAPAVNVLELNLRLDELARRSGARE